MVDFESPYYIPMDQQYHREVQNADSRSENLEKPLFPISKIGMTVPEHDPSGRNRHIIEGVDAAIRGGAGNIQLVMSGIGQQAAMGQASGPKGYGTEVREAIRELQKASGATITGLELPTSISNLSGFSQNGFSEEQRKMALEEVRDSIKFVGDIAGGGGVDVLSWEFARNFSDTDWAKEDGKLFKQKGDEQVFLVDTKTGEFSAKLNKKERVPIIDKDYFNDEKVHMLSWQELEDYSKKTKPGEAPAKVWWEKQYDTQVNRIKGEKAYYESLVDQEERSAKQIQNRIEEVRRQNPEEYRLISDDLNKEVISHKRRIESFKQSLSSMEIQEARLKEDQGKFETVNKFGLDKATETYAEAGISAMYESQKNQWVQRGKGSIYVGPEIGWPQYYGSHPKEWVELIKKSREEMAEMLVTEKLPDGKDNPYFNPDITKNEAEQFARQHIKGELDTSHLNMWLQNFKPELSWDKRVSEFKDWYKKQIEFLADENKKHDIIGGIQLVDSASGAHGHLTPGQGVLGKDIYDYMKILKERGGYKGDITSEGHEEEKFGHGRMLTKSWEVLGAPIGTGYFQGRPMPQFGDVRSSYAQRAYGTTGIFQSYVPSNDFRLWSDVPLE